MRVGKIPWIGVRFGPLPELSALATIVAHRSEQNMRSAVNANNTRRVLCVFPIYEPSFGTFSHAFRLVGARAFMPPQGLLLIANYLPENWPVRFIDENMGRANASDFEWADVVLVTGMHIQAAQINDICRRAKAAGKV